MAREFARTDQARTRLSGGFTLDEVARLYRASLQGRRMTCPSCGSPMQDVPGCCPGGRVSLLHCATCGRGLVFDRPLGPPTV